MTFEDIDRYVSNQILYDQHKDLTNKAKDERLNILEEEPTKPDTILDKLAILEKKMESKLAAFAKQPQQRGRSPGGDRRTGEG